MSVEKLADRIVECAAAAEADGTIFCGLEHDHGGPHFSVGHEIFWMTPDEALAMTAALRLLAPEISEARS